VTAGGDIVVISPDGTIWDLPAGRPEPGETWEDTRSPPSSGASLPKPC
jgi:hypothetical protein